MEGLEIAVGFIFGDVFVVDGVFGIGDGLIFEIFGDRGFGDGGFVAVRGAGASRPEPAWANCDGLGGVGEGCH